MINPLTLREHFKATYGNEPEWYLRKDVALVNLGRGYKEIPSDHPMFEELKDNQNKFVDELDSTPHEEHSKNAWRAWQTSTSDFMNGNVHRVAKQVLAMEKDLKERSRPIDVPLYRGATNPPDEDIKGRDFISASEDRGAADKFARQSRVRYGTGRTDQFKIGQAHGFPLSEISGTRTVRVGKNNESEWIITDTGGQKFPKKRTKKQP